jgi:hypothetical protein
MRVLVSILTGAALCATSAQAQDAQKEVQREQKMRVERDVLNFTSPKDNFVYESHAIGAGPNVVQFISTEASISGKIVKNAPYSAEAVTETSQTLADGNRIAHKTTATTYRDAEGRTRRDMILPAIGPLAAGDAPSLVIINDPVANVTYQLDNKAKTARKMPGLGGMAMSFTRGPEGVAGLKAKLAAEAGSTQSAPVMIARRAIPAAGGQTFQKEVAPPKTEALGKQTIDGVEAEGTRTTITIPAGEIGNEREINIVNERWYSPELQTVIMSKHSDPRMGETLYKLTNIRRNDPHPSLFQVPPDYTMETAEAPMIRMMRAVEK